MTVVTVQINTIPNYPYQHTAEIIEIVILHKDDENENASKTL